LRIGKQRTNRHHDQLLSFPQDRFGDRDEQPRRRTLDHDVCVSGERVQSDHRGTARQGLEKRAGTGGVAYRHRAQRQSGDALVEPARDCLSDRAQSGDRYTLHASTPLFVMYEIAGAVLPFYSTVPWSICLWCRRSRRPPLTRAWLQEQQELRRLSGLAWSARMDKSLSRLARYLSITGHLRRCASVHTLTLKPG
jgi:hypothetical protein